MTISEDEVFPPRAKPETKAEVVKSYISGLNVDRVGAMFGVSASTVRKWVQEAGGKMRRYGVTRSSKRQEIDPALREKIAEEYLTTRRSAYRIAAEHNLSEPTVRACVGKDRMRPPGRRLGGKAPQAKPS